MAYKYAKNIKSLKRNLSKKGFVISNVGRTNKRFDLDGEHKYYFNIKKKRK